MLLSDVLLVCLTSVTYIGPKSRTERPRKIKIGTAVAHVTRDSDTTFSIKRSNVKVTRPLYSCTAVLRRRSAAPVSVGTYCYVSVSSAAWGASAPAEGGEGPRVQLVCFEILIIIFVESWCPLFRWQLAQGYGGRLPGRTEKAFYMRRERLCWKINRSSHYWCSFL